MAAGRPVTVVAGRPVTTVAGTPVTAPGNRAAPGERPARAGNQALVSCLASWLLIATFRGFAASCTGMARVSTPAV